MKVQALKCPECGANIEIDKPVDVCYCNYCGAKLAVEEDNKDIIYANVRQKELEHETDMQIRQHSYEIKKAQIDKNRKNFQKLIPYIAAFIVLIFVAFGIVSAVNNGKSEKTSYEAKLESIEAEVNKLIDSGEYDLAYTKAQYIRANDISSNKEKAKWDDIRKSLLDRIFEEKVKNGIIIKLPSAAVDYEKKNYEEVVAELTEAGFQNIKTKAIYDLKTGWIVKDGTVEKVSIDGDTDFLKGSTVYYDVQIVITYHTLKKNESQ